MINFKYKTMPLTTKKTWNLQWIVPAVSIQKKMELIQGEKFVRFQSDNDLKNIRLWMDKNMTILHIGDINDNTSVANAIELLDVTEVRYGCETDTFLDILKRHLKKKNSRSSWLWKKILEYLLWVIRIKRWIPRLAIAGPPPPVSPTNCFSVVYMKDNKHQTLDLQSDDTETTLQWCKELKGLVDTIRQHQQAKDNRDWLMTKFQEADTNHSGSLDWNETCQLLTDLNTKKSPEEIKILFDLANTNPARECGQQVLDFDEFLQFYELLVERPEISQIYQEYANSDGNMDAQSLLNFFAKAQFERDVDVEDLIERYEKNDGIREQRQLSLRGFSSLMKSFDAIKDIDTVDMDQPLVDYYICSSHNTYLEGNQLVGKSTIEGYVSALEKGCRCIELDLWDGSDGEPVIYHGHTFTTEILARDVLRHGILPYAFKFSPYPLILSVESHLSLKQQDVFADDLSRIFDEALYRGDEQNLTQLPSPNQLRGKVIVKTDVTKQLSDKLAELCNICQQIKFESFEKSASSDSCYHVTGFSEMEAKQIIEKSSTGIVEHSERQLNRVYPFGLRVQSGNFDPIPFWNCGLQMVALNVQTGDDHLTTNLGRFRSTGNCGFVLKPKAAIRQVVQEDMQSAPVRMSLKVRIISGQNLPKESATGDPISPYVCVQVRGHNVDDTPIHKTETVPNNGLNPFWDTTFRCSIKVPELALISFTVYNNNRPLAALAVPVLDLARGYRHVTLTTLQGIPLPVSSLFIHSSIDVYDG